MQISALTNNLKNTTNKICNMNEENMFTNIENQIRLREPKIIRLMPLTKDRGNQTLEEFLIKFFSEWNFNKLTVYADSRDVQTDIGKRRSLGDIFLICQYYYPTSTLKDVINLLYNVLPLSMDEGFRSSYCYTIKKRVWYFDDENDSVFLNSEMIDEFGYETSAYRKAFL